MNPAGLPSVWFSLSEQIRFHAEPGPRSGRFWPGPRVAVWWRWVSLALTMPLSLPLPPHCTWYACVSPLRPAWLCTPAPGSRARPGPARRPGAGGTGRSARPRPTPPGPPPPPAASPAPAGPCLMDESWFVTPPPCFTAEEPGPDGVGSSPMEDLLIEHPSMSVYVTSTLEVDGEGPEDDAAE